jgi:hypothetical protein
MRPGGHSSSGAVLIIRHFLRRVRNGSMLSKKLFEGGRPGIEPHALEPMMASVVY